MDEQQASQLSQIRGRLAAKMEPGSEEQRKYIAQQGEAEAKNKKLPWNWLKDSDIQSKTMRDQATGLPSIK